LVVDIVVFYLLLFSKFSRVDINDIFEIMQDKTNNATFTLNDHIRPEDIFSSIINLKYVMLF